MSNFLKKSKPFYEGRRGSVLVDARHTMTVTRTEFDAAMEQQQPIVADDAIVQELLEVLRGPVGE